VGLSALLSNLVSNVPAVLLLAPVVEGAADPALWLALAASSTLAGNATLVGAAANVIVAETARALGAEFSVRRFMAAGLPTALLTLGLAVLLLR
jgi:Na+/H+ antiporter NhaD/arsenite permease-like protein